MSGAHPAEIEAAGLRVEVEMLRERMESDKEQARALSDELRGQVSKTEERERKLRDELADLRRRTWQKPEWWP